MNEKRQINMRTIQFKMERQGLVTEGQEVEITDHEADSGSCYIIEPQLPCPVAIKAVTV